MEQTSEYGIAETEPAPWWVRRIAFFSRLWINPIFQRNFARSRVKKMVFPRTAAIVTFVYSLLVNLAFLFPYGIDPITKFSAGLLISVGVPVGILFFITYIRMFIVCLITTPIELRTNTTTDGLSPTFSTPMKDSDIYYAECLPNFVRGLQVTESILSVFIATLIPWIAFNLIFIITYDSKTGEEVFMVGMGVLAFLYILSGLIMMMLLLSLTSGLYSIKYPATGAIILILLHYGFINGLSSQVAQGFFVVNAYVGAFTRPGYESILAFIGFGALVVVKTGIVALGCLITSRFGISAFANVRRSGFYEPDRKSAAGLGMMESRSLLKR